MGITQPGGAGTIIYLYDDTDATNHAAAPGPHTFAEIAAAFAADFVDNGTFEKSYRGKVDVQVGDAGTGTATTTLTDSSGCVDWDSGKGLRYRATQATSWNTNLGTKVGSGNSASGKAGCKIYNSLSPSLMRGVFKLYGLHFRSNQTAQFVPAADDNGSELVNCLLDSTFSSGVTASFVMGAATARISNIYNVDITSATTGPVIGNWGSVNAERLSISASAPTAFMQNGVANISLKDAVLFGSPTTSDFRWTSVLASGWQLVRPRFSGNALKFSSTSGAGPSLANGCKEYWGWDVKVVDRNGAGIPNIPVTLTDATGVAQVDTTTGSDGTLTYGSGLTASSIILVDHYISTTYQIQHRSPFDVKINMPTQTGYNSNYQSKHYKFYPAGYETYTTSGGSFEDIEDIVPLQEQAGNPTTWVECEMP